MVAGHNKPIQTYYDITISLTGIAVSLTRWFTLMLNGMVILYSDYIIRNTWRHI